MAGFASCVGATSGAKSEPTNSACTACDTQLDTMGRIIIVPISAIASIADKAYNPMRQRELTRISVWPDLLNQPCMDASRMWTCTM